MKLLTDELRKQLPPLYATETADDPLVICKFFMPDFPWTWYAIEFDGEDLFWSLVAGDYSELGYFRLSELRSVRGKWGCPMERDIDFEPQSLSEVRKRHEGRLSAF